MFAWARTCRLYTGSTGASPKNVSHSSTHIKTWLSDGAWCIPLPVSQANEGDDSKTIQSRNEKQELHLLPICKSGFFWDSCWCSTRTNGKAEMVVCSAVIQLGTLR
jgi:hypothetical protein